MNRKYRISNAALLVFAKETLKNFRQNLILFTAFDAERNAERNYCHTIDLRLNTALGRQASSSAGYERTA